MKLYQTQNGRWVGTQADAKADGKNWKAVEVPTDKPSLIAWLNENCATAGASQSTPMTLDGGLPKTVSRPATETPHAWQTIRECAEKASIADLTVALAVLMNRVSDLADQVGE
jgi:hypothetical protein